MAYRLGESEAIEVSGITFWVKRAAAPRFRFLKALDELPDDASQVELAEVETQFLLDVVTGVEGLEDAEGRAIEELTEESLWELDPETKIELAESCLSGTAGDGSGKAAASVSKPEDGRRDGE